MILDLDKAQECVDYIASKGGLGVFPGRILYKAHRNLQWYYHSPNGVDGDPHFYSDVIVEFCYAASGDDTYEDDDFPFKNELW